MQFYPLSHCVLRVTSEYLPHRPNLQNPQPILLLLRQATFHMHTNKGQDYSSLYEYINLQAFRLERQKKSEGMAAGIP